MRGRWRQCAAASGVKSRPNRPTCSSRRGSLWQSAHLLCHDARLEVVGPASGGAFTSRRSAFEVDGPFACKRRAPLPQRSARRRAEARKGANQSREINERRSLSSPRALKAHRKYRRTSSPFRHHRLPGTRHHLPVAYEGMREHPRVPLGAGKIGPISPRQPADQPNPRGRPAPKAKRQRQGAGRALCLRSFQVFLF